MNRALVALVDDHELLTYTLATALKDVNVATVTIAPRPLQELLHAIKAYDPQLVLLDLDLGTFGDATALIAPLADAGIRVIVLTGETNRIRLAEVLEAGAIAIHQKSADFDALLRAIQLAASTTVVHHSPEHQELLAELTAHRAEESSLRAPFERLTEREQETLQQLAQGHTVAAIAGGWVVSETTVRSHVRAILHKLDASSQLQAVVRAVHAGWITPEAETSPAERNEYLR